MKSLADILEPCLHKIQSVNGLPTYSEVIDFMRQVALSSPAEIATAHLHLNNVFNIWNVEFVDALAHELRKYRGVIIEVGAGDGKLSYHLRDKGINITPTDDQSGDIVGNGSLVEKLNHFDALQKYNPATVIASCVPYITQNVLSFPSIGQFVQIFAINGFHPDIVSKQWLKSAGFEEIILEDVQRYGICSGDYYPGGLGHMVVSLMRGVNQSRDTKTSLPSTLT